MFVLPHPDDQAPALPHWCKRWRGGVCRPYWTLMVPQVRHRKYDLRVMLSNSC